MSYWYISFTTPDEFLGATVVEAEKEEEALEKVEVLGIAPEREKNLRALVLKVPEECCGKGRKDVEGYMGRLVGKEEILENGGGEW